MGVLESVNRDEPGWNDGVFLVDKPAGMTSFAIVRRIRWLLGIKKVGHAGTLDPFATGLLIVCVGRTATRCVDSFMGGRKTYQARLQLGVETETQDPEGAVVHTAHVPGLTQPALEACLRQHVGLQLQAPPPYSAAKHKGKPLYAYARQGVRIDKEPKPITVHSLAFDRYDDQTHQLDVTVVCSRGTYVRVLAADIGRALGCGAHLIGLRRIASGPFTTDDCLPGASLFTEEGLAVLHASRRAIAETLAIVEEGRI
jgi:tRNA pseudouridine55 synthase